MHAVIRFRSLLLNLAIPVVGGFVSALLAGSWGGGFYNSLRLPGFAPPPAVFGIVWTVLYLLMGFAAYLVCTARGLSHTDRKPALTLYAFALLAGYLWNFLFFRFHLLTFSSLWIVVVLAVTALCMTVFYRIRPAAGLLIAPTVLWIAFATALNIAIAAMN